MKSDVTVFSFDGGNKLVKSLATADIVTYGFAATHLDATQAGRSMFPK